MRALIISTHVPYFPASGASTRDHYLFKYLAKDHQLKVLAPIYNEEQADLAQNLPSWVDFEPVYVLQPLANSSRKSLPLFSFLRQSRLQRLAHMMLEAPYEIKQLNATLSALRISLGALRWENIDIVQIEHSVIGRLRKVIPSSIPTVLDCHNVHSAMSEREYRRANGWRKRSFLWTEWQKMRSYEGTTIKKFDWLFACSETDKLSLLGLDDSVSCSVVPNGVDTEYFTRRENSPSDDLSLLFVGSMSYEPNVEAMVYFFEQVFPVLKTDFPNTKVYIVGRNPSATVFQLEKRFSNNVVVTGTVGDVRPYMECASIGIVPLLTGGGTRLKILEMLSMKMPVVTTSIGCEGIKVVDGKHLLVADTPESFAKSIRILLRNPDLRNRLGTNGNELVKSIYEWREIARIADSVWQSLGSRSGALPCPK